MNTNQILTKEGLPPKIDANQTLYSLKTRIRNWHKTSMLNVRKTMVFSGGIANADIMIIGEAPGYDEERLGEPFVGQVGRKLDGILKAMGVDRKNVYTTNILKYRPSMPDQTTNNRQPTVKIFLAVHL
jgi:uracil-DNA glycosylase family 4